MKQDLAIPEEFLRDHIADLGKTGSGKTSSLKTIVEWLALQPTPARVCVLDPIKSDWWGVTSSADGKRPGLPFQIMGGPHGHVPLRSDQGAIVGELVAKGQLPLSIVDMADFEPGGLQRFFIDFSHALLRHIKGVLYLVLEEAHEFAPKERAGIGNENLSVHWAKKLATAGRSKGVRLLVATQRTQALHNAVLGSCETLLAHRLTAPADQKPVQDWLKANADKETAREIGESMSQLKTGTAWVVSAGMNFAGRVIFPRIVTFDNSATPDSDDELARVKTAPVDRGALAEMLRISAEEIDRTDPEKLYARIKELQNQLANRPAIIEQDTELLEKQSYSEGYTAGHAQGRADAAASIAGLFEPVLDHVGDLNSNLAALTREAGAVWQWLDDAGKKPSEYITDIMRGTSVPVPLPMAPIKREAAPRDLRNEDTSRQGNAPGITPSLQKVLDALAWFRKIGIDPVARDRVCVVAGYSPNASTFGVYTSQLGKMGLITAGNGALSLTPEGARLANVPRVTSRADLFNAAAAMLNPRQRQVFELVYRRWPKSKSRDDIASDMGLSTNASTLGVYISGVARMGIIENAEPGHVRAAAWLFPEGVR